jgi:hypothetical protein
MKLPRRDHGEVVRKGRFSATVLRLQQVGFDVMARLV